MNMVKRTKKLVLGIDPGSISGAYAVLAMDEDENIEVHACDDLPVVQKNVNAFAFRDLVGGWVGKAKWHGAPLEVVMERVNAFPRQGVSSAFNFGRGFGIAEGVCAGCMLPLTLVSPAKWKAAMGLNRDGEASRALATRLYPKTAHALRHKKHHGRAEAVLLAHYHIGGWRP